MKDCLITTEKVAEKKIFHIKHLMVRYCHLMKSVPMLLCVVALPSVRLKTSKFMVFLKTFC